MVLHHRRMSRLSSCLPTSLGHCHSVLRTLLPLLAAGCSGFSSQLLSLPVFGEVSHASKNLFCKLRPKAAFWRLVSMCCNAAATSMTLLCNSGDTEFLIYHMWLDARCWLSANSLSIGVSFYSNLVCDPSICHFNAVFLLFT